MPDRDIDNVLRASPHERGATTKTSGGTEVYEFDHDAHC